MKRILPFKIYIILIVFGVLFTGFTPASAQQRGGILRVVTGAGPQVLGYYPEMGPFDHGACFPAIECIMELNKDREYVPFLAESVNLDPKKLTMTIRVRKGIRFTDGSELNADSVAWNYKLLKDTNKLQFGTQVKSIDIIDKYTIVLRLTGYNNQMLYGLGWVPMFSKVAFEKNGKEWARANPVCTGPFKLVEFKRDVDTKWERNPDYWQKDKGYPYLDGVEFRFILDSTTASAMFQAHEADIWQGPPVREMSELVKKGYKDQSGWAGLPIILYLNTKDPKAPTYNIKVREAIEYSINKSAMAKSLGYGFWTPLKLVAPPGEWGYDAKYKGREYNPKKARQLLAEAGYANRLKLKLLVLPEVGGRNVAAEVIKSFMDDAGFDVDVDIADPGRYYGSVFGTGWEDMALFLCGTDYNYLATFQSWFGHAPRTNLASFKRPAKLLAMSKRSITYTSRRAQIRITKQMVRYIADDALMIPLYFQPGSILIQKWVHTNRFKGYGLGRWTLFEDWMEKH